MRVTTVTDTLEVQLLHPDAQPPARTRPGDAGFDLRCVEAFSLAPGERRVVPTGVAVALPEGVAGLVVPRSGLAARHGISVVNGPGLIDPTYRGEIRVVLVNLGAGALRGRGRRPHRAAAARPVPRARDACRRDAAAVGRRARRRRLRLLGPLERAQQRRGRRRGQHDTRNGARRHTSKPATPTAGSRASIAYTPVVVIVWVRISAASNGTGARSSSARTGGRISRSPTSTAPSALSA